MIGINVNFDFKDILDALSQARLVSYSNMQATLNDTGKILVKQMRDYATDPELSNTKWGKGEESGDLRRSIGYETQIAGSTVSLDVGMGLGAPIPLTKQKGDYPGGEEYWKLIDQGEESGSKTRDKVHYTPTPAGKPIYIYESQGKKIGATSMGIQKGRHFIRRTNEWFNSNPPAIENAVNAGAERIAKMIDYATSPAQRQAIVAEIVAKAKAVSVSREM